MGKNSNQCKSESTQKGGTLLISELEFRSQDMPHWVPAVAVFNGQSLEVGASSGGNNNTMSLLSAPISAILAVECLKEKNFWSRCTYILCVTTLANTNYFLSGKSKAISLEWIERVQSAIEAYLKTADAGKSAGDTANNGGPSVLRECPVVLGEDTPRWAQLGLTQITLAYHRTEAAIDIVQERFLLEQVKVESFGARTLQITTVNNKSSRTTRAGDLELTFECSRDAQEWLEEIEAGKTAKVCTDAGNTIFRQRIYKGAGNASCADCLSANPLYAALDRGITLCQHCASVHRRYTKVVTLVKHASYWTDTAVELFRLLGNDFSNSLLQEQQEQLRLSSKDSMDTRREFIGRKYVDKAWMTPVPPPTTTTLTDLQLNLFRAIQTPDVRQTLHTIYLGASVALRNVADGKSYQTIAKEAGQIYQAELLFHNGGCLPAENRRLPIGHVIAPLIQRGEVLAKFNSQIAYQPFSVHLEWGQLILTGADGAKGRFDCRKFTTVYDGKDAICAFFVQSSVVLLQIQRSLGEDEADWKDVLVRSFAPQTCLGVLNRAVAEFAICGYVTVKTSLSTPGSFNWVYLRNRILFLVDGDAERTICLNLRKVRKVVTVENRHRRTGPRLKAGDESTSGSLPYALEFLPSKRIVYIQAETREANIVWGTVLTREVTHTDPDGLDDQYMGVYDIPFLVIECTRFIERRGLLESGIYRVNGVHKVIKQLYDQFHKAPDTVRLCVDASRYTVNDVAGVLKKFLRELDNPVGTKQLHRTWLETARLKNPEERNKQFENILNRLPFTNLLTLTHLVHHLRLVANEEKNLMTTDNLGRIFGPIIFSPIRADDAYSFSDTEAEIQLMIYLLENDDRLFASSQDSSLSLDAINLSTAMKQLDDLMLGSVPATGGGGCGAAESRLGSESFSRKMQPIRISDATASAQVDTNEELFNMTAHPNEEPVAALAGEEEYENWNTEKPPIILTEQSETAAMPEAEAALTDRTHLKEAMTCEEFGEDLTSESIAPAAAVLQEFDTSKTNDHQSLNPNSNVEVAGEDTEETFVKNQQFSTDPTKIDRTATGGNSRALSKAYLEIHTCINAVVTQHGDPRATYKFLSSTHIGSTSTIFQAINLETSKWVAVKVINLKKNKKRELVLREVKVAASLEHENIINFYSTYLVEHEVMIVMELAALGNLADMLANTKFSHSQIATVAASMLSALDYLSANKYIHRGVRANSILVTEKGKLKLSDFGTVGKLTASKPQSTAILGPVHHMAPEMVLSEPYDSGVDVWAMGITVVEMIEGMPPNFHEEPFVVVDRIRNAARQSIYANKELSDDLQRFIRRFLEPNQKLRPTAAQLLKDPYIIKYNSKDKCL